MNKATVRIYLMSEVTWLYPNGTKNAIYVYNTGLSL